MTNSRLRNALALFSLLFVFWGVLAGCSQEEETNIYSAPAEPAMEVASSGNNPGQRDGELLVAIEPEEPGVGDALHGRIQNGDSVKGWTWYRNGDVLPDATTLVLPAHSAARGDVVTLIVRGNRQEVSATVEIGNSPPEVVTVNLETNEIFRGRDIVALPEVADPDGDEVEFRFEWLINGDPVSFQTEATLPGEAFLKGDEVFLRVTPFDGQDEGPVFVPEPFVIPNGPPRFSSSPSAQFMGMEYRYQVVAEDPDGDPLLYALEEGPEGMTIEQGSGLLIWDLSGKPIGDFPVTISVTDDEGLWARQTFTVQMIQPER